MTKQGCCFERPNFIMANRKSGKRSANNRRGWMVIVGTGSSRWSRSGLLVQDWYSLDRWSLVQDWFQLVQEVGRWCRTGSCWYRLVQEIGRWFRTSSRWCRELAAGAGVVVAAAVKWSPVQEGSCWYRLKEY